MARIEKAVAYGAVTIINAISCGYGAALGVNLKTEATVRLINEPGRIEGKILSDREESTVLIEKTVSCVLRHFGLEGEYGAYVETQSNIPIARGLKSSSAAANAVALASLAAIEKEVSDLTVINIGVDAALEAGVTITGAFDDASASFFGGIVITNNLERKILKKFYPHEYLILIHVPETKLYTASSNVQKMKLMANEVKALHKMALQGDWLNAMTLNGLVYSTVLGVDTNLVIDALDAGALAAGLSGKGPAVAAVVLPEKAYDVKETWKKYEGNIIETQINTKKSHKV
ncbi:shikimate kinase [Candidatus Bathyarchaeota archaeon]|nr:shikimate kinase [Candidatus Bathyarchaeota archaeon]